MDFENLNSNKEQLFQCKDFCRHSSAIRPNVDCDCLIGDRRMANLGDPSVAKTRAIALTDLFFLRGQWVFLGPYSRLVRILGPDWDFRVSLVFHIVHGLEWCDVEWPDWTFQVFTRWRCVNPDLSIVAVNLPYFLYKHILRHSIYQIPVTLVPDSFCKGTIVFEKRYASPTLSPYISQV